MCAGTSSVLVSLWPVEDKATRDLMTRFYELWNGGEPAPRALKLAQDHIRKNPSWENPRFWAAWQLWGLPD